MSEEIIRKNNSAYAKYEELILRRDELKKEALHIEHEYIRKFGDLILEIYRKKMECIRKKKTIEYCRTFINRGENVDMNALQEHLQQEMREYQERLEDMMKENEAAKNAGTISESEFLEIKRIYHRLVKKLHPDIHPETLKNEKLAELWHRLQVEYNCNDLKGIRETEVIINSILENAEPGAAVNIPDIDEKIKELENEIEEIKSTEPYKYKYILDDKAAMAEKKKELRQELEEYEDYSRKLDEMMSEIAAEGVTFTWEMN